jgi:hypothetical protein
MLVKNGESRDLANAMKKLLDDLNLHEEFCCAARSVQESHPNLAQVAEQWLRAGSAQ